MSVIALIQSMILVNNNKIARKKCENVLQNVVDIAVKNVTNCVSVVLVAKSVTYN
jgi:hypothetical protein